MKIEPCVQCGFCCTRGPCSYGKWDNVKKQCAYLVPVQDSIKRICSKYNEIKRKETIYPMMDCGCSSSLFNEVRDNVIRSMKV